MIAAFLLKYLSGVWGYVASAALAGILCVGATHSVDALVYGRSISGLQLEISGMQTSVANRNAADVAGSLAKLQGFIAGMQTADADYNAALTSINSHFAAVEGEFKSATQKPLPVDCKPDANRLRTLTAAVAATSTAAVTTAPAQ